LTSGRTTLLKTQSNRDELCFLAKVCLSEEAGETHVLWRSFSTRNSLMSLNSKKKGNTKNGK